MEIVALVIIGIVVAVVVLWFPTRRKTQRPPKNVGHLKHRHRVDRAKAMQKRLKDQTPGQ